MSKAKELLEKLNKLNFDEQQLNEFAWDSQCGTELTEIKISRNTIKNPTLTQKIKQLIKITDGEEGIVINHRISNAFNFNFEGIDYTMLINIGQSIDSDIDIRDNFGTSHMQTKHWQSSIKTLEKFEDATKNGFLMPSYDEKLEEEYNKVWLIYDDREEVEEDTYGKYIYVIGLSDGTEQSVTVMITCFNYTTSKEGHLNSKHIEQGIKKAKIENRIYWL